MQSSIPVYFLFCASIVHNLELQKETENQMPERQITSSTDLNTALFWPPDHSITRF